MKPAPFAYIAPRTLEEACAALAEHGEDAKVLAGGQSLVPLMNFRLAVPEVIVDLNHVADLDHLRAEAGEVTIGALVRQRTAERSEVVRTALPLVPEALAWVGHIGIRNRGTVVGSLAHADPAAELPAVLTALDASALAVSATGRRWIPATELLQGYFTTSLRADELIAEIRVPGTGPTVGSAWVEFARRHGDFALAGVAAVVALDPDARCTAARLVVAGVGSVPFDAVDAAALVVGARMEPDLLAEAGVRAAADCDPPSDLNADARYRRRLVARLVPRALQIAWRRAEGDGSGT